MVSEKNNYYNNEVSNFLKRELGDKVFYFGGIC